MTETYVTPPLTILTPSGQLLPELQELGKDQEWVADQAARVRRVARTLREVLRHALGDAVSEETLTQAALAAAEELGRRAEDLDLSRFSLCGIDRLLVPVVALHLLRQAYREGILRTGFKSKNAIAVLDGCPFGFGKDRKTLSMYGRTWKLSIFRRFKAELRKRRS